MSDEKKDATNNDQNKEPKKEEPESLGEKISGLFTKGKETVMKGTEELSQKIAQGHEDLSEYFNIANELIHAQQILTVMMSANDNSIPSYIIKNAKGFAFMTEVKAGLLVSASAGSGIVIARTEDGWSGPCNFGFASGGFGFQVGAAKTEIILVLNTDKAVKAFGSFAQMTVGADLQVTAGPIGREISGSLVGSVTAIAPVYSYSHSKGVFAGLALDGTVIITRDAENEKFYGKAVEAGNILSGHEKVPDSTEYKKLISVLEESTKDEEKKDEEKKR